MTHKTHYWFWGLSGFFILFDQILKYIAATYPNASWYLVGNIIGWEFYANDGIAFGIPFPPVPLILISIVIIGFLIHLTQNNTIDTYTRLGAHLVIAGAVSNVIDRIFFGITIDYLRIFYSVANMADAILIVGTALLFIYWGKREPHVHNNQERS